MSIQRVPSVPFAQIANAALRDSRLSFKARGLLALVLSHSGEWNATAQWLESQSQVDGRGAIQTALNELTEYGYRSVSREHKNGVIRTVVVWRHSPELQVSRPTGNVTVRERVGHESGGSLEHYSSEHYVEEHHEQTDAPRNDQNSATHDSLTLSGKTRQNAPTGLFDAFWAVYPRKAAKRAALGAWDKACRRADPQEILDGAVAYARDPNRQDEYTKHAATWLNGDCWADEPLPAPRQALTNLERKRQHQADTLMAFMDRREIEA